MRYIYALFFSIGLICTSVAQVPSGYYSTADGLVEEALKTELKEIINDINSGNETFVHIDQGYGELWTAYQNPESGDLDIYESLENDNTILDIYSENPDASDPYNFTPVNDQCGNYQDEGDCYNREHVVPQSFFNGASPMRNDYHSTFPTDGKVNGFRGSLPYGEVSSASNTTANGSQIGPSNSPDYNGNVFEPIDEYKGDIARALFYFATRYQDEFNNGSWDNPDDNFLDDNYLFYDQWLINVLLQWHQQDPVDQKEIDRNNNGFDHQFNRNPFVDHPDFALAIWDEGFNVADFSIADFKLTPNPVVNGNLKLKLNNIQKGNLRLYDLTGQQIRHYQIDNQITNLQLNFLAQGIYIAEFTSDKVKLTKKLIIK
ncbi:MAG: endonuclease [Psychroflexus sp.]|nr:endonuclease [Psychroflexus sp.]MDR9448830.1 endonuclease [Psychroflexus sp.]